MGPSSVRKKLGVRMRIHADQQHGEQRVSPEVPRGARSSCFQMRPAPAPMIMRTVAQHGEAQHQLYHQVLA